MFLRFHNFVAFKLKSGNAMWSDEKLYQESRRFVGAIIQHITYTQFLPIILGILSTGYFKVIQYIPSIYINNILPNIV